MITSGKFSFQAGMENAARFVEKGMFISWRMTEKKKGSLFNFFFPKFCIPAFSGMLILVKYMHAYNFLGQEQIQQIINFSISSLIQLIR